MRPIEKFVYIALALYLFAAFAVLWAIGREVRERERVRRWPRVRGRVIGHRTRYDELGRPTFETRVEYDYGGESYDEWAGCEDRRAIAASRTTVTHALLERRNERHPAGSEFEVFVNPDDPREAKYPERRLSGTFYLAVVGTLFAAGFVFALYVAGEFLR